MLLAFHSSDCPVSLSDWLLVAGRRRRSSTAASSRRAASSCWAARPSSRAWWTWSATTRSIPCTARWGCATPSTRTRWTAWAPRSVAGGHAHLTLTLCDVTGWWGSSFDWVEKVLFIDLLLQILLEIKLAGLTDKNPLLVTAIILIIIITIILTITG